MKKEWKVKRCLLLVLGLIIFSSVVLAVECGKVPTNDCFVTQNTNFETGDYYLERGIALMGNNINLDCNNSILVGNDNSSIGISIIIGNNNRITNCTVRNYTTGVDFPMGSFGGYNLLEKSQIEYCKDGFFAWDAHNDKIIESRFFNNREKAIFISSGSNYSLENNLIENCTRCISVDDHPSLKIINNKISGKFSDGIYIYNGNVEIKDNTIVGGNNGIFIWDSFGSLVQGNSFNNNTIGINLWQNVQFSNLIDNTLINNSNKAILIDNKPSIKENINNNTIINNKVYASSIYDGIPQLNTYCIQCRGNDYFNGATGPTCPLSCDDDDNDTILNGNDTCPNTPLGETVNAFGCSCSQITCNINQQCTDGTCYYYTNECGKGPRDFCYISKNTTFKTGVYYINYSVTIQGNGIVLDCNNSILIGNGNFGGIHFITSTRNSHVINCILKNFTAGIYSEWENNRIENNTISECETGIGAYYNAHNNIIKTNKIFNSTKGIWLFYGSNFTLLSNEIEDCYIGIYSENHQFSAIIDNKIKRGGLSGMHIEGTHIVNYSNKNRIINNSILDGDLGILIYDSNSNIIQDNSILNNRREGLSLFGSVMYSNITKNIFKNNSASIKVGDWFLTESYYNNIWDNYVYVNPINDYNESLNNYCINCIGNNYYDGATGPTCPSSCDDDDNDTILNGNDTCPNTPLGEKVNASGCSCSQLICDDGNPCTDDFCDNSTVSCISINDDTNICGNVRDCPDTGCDIKSPWKDWLTFPPDGTDYCVTGKCTEYSCNTTSRTYNKTCDPDWDNDDVNNNIDSCPTTYGIYCHGCPQPSCGACKVAYCPSSGAPYCIASTTPECNGFTANIIFPKPFDYNTTKIYFNITANENLKYIKYSDLNDRRPHNITLCSNCKGYGYDRVQYKTLSEGNHSLMVYFIRNNNSVYTDNVTFFIDATKPLVFSQKPRNKGFCNGNFTVRYSEEYPISVNLHYGTNVISQVISKKDCPAGRNQECNFFINLSGYENQNLAFYFDVQDIFSTVAYRNTYTCFVDTTPPHILYVNSSRDRSYLYLNISLNQKAKYLKYIDNGPSRPMESVLCSNCNEYGKSRVQRRSFGRGYHNLTIVTQDEASNMEKSKSISFWV